MDNQLFLVVAVSVLVVLAMLGTSYLTYKKVDLKGDLEKIKAFLVKGESVTKVAEGLTVGKTKAVLEDINSLEDVALKGVNYAEQLLVSAQIENDPDGSKRRTVAINFTYAYLQSRGIEITDNIKTVVNGLIESTIFTDKNVQQINEQLDKLVGEKVTALQSQVTTLIAEKAKLEGTVAELTTKNTELDSKLVSIQTAVK